MISGVLKWSMASVFDVSIGSRAGVSKCGEYRSCCLKDWLLFNLIGVEDTVPIDQSVHRVFKSFVRLRNGISW
jgi:hypothetical protein